MRVNAVSRIARDENRDIIEHDNAAKVIR